MDKIVASTIELFKDVQKDDELTVELVADYLSSKHFGIVSLNELMINLATDKNRSKINFDIVENEYNKIKIDVAKYR